MTFKGRDSRMVWTPVVALAAICALFTILNPTFASLGNAQVIVGHAAVLTLVALGMTVVVRTGGVDLSIAVAVDFGALVTVAMMHDGYTFPFALVGGVLAGVLLGCINALLIVGAGMDPILTTLGTLFLGQGAQAVYTEGGSPIFLPVESIPDAFYELGHLTLLGLPVAVFIALAAVAAFWVLLEKSTFGRTLVAIGAQRPAAEAAGLPVRRDLFLAYVICGGIGAFAGVVLSAGVSSYTPEAGYGYLLDAVGAVFVGTTMHKEGRPNVLGTLLGVLFFGVISNGMVLAGIPFQWQRIAEGGLLLAVLGANMALRRSPTPLFTSIGRILRPNQVGGGR